MLHCITRFFHCTPMLRCGSKINVNIPMLIRRCSVCSRGRGLGRSYQVTVLGGGNEVGQAISLLLRSQTFISKLVIHDDEAHTPGVILDLSHIPTDTALSGYSGPDTLTRALRNSDLIIAAGGVTRKPEISKDQFMVSNAEFIKNAAMQVSKIQPLPMFGIVTEPINMLLPMAAEIMKYSGEYDPKKLFGITTMDPLRAQAIYAFENKLNPKDCLVPVIGGHSEKTAVPLFTQAWPKCDNLPDKAIQELTHRARRGADVIVMAKKGYAPTLSVAYGVLEFTRGILGAMDGTPTTLHAYVENNDFGSGYLSGLCDIDENGVFEMRRYQNLSPLECHLLERSITQIRKDVSRGKRFLEAA